MGEGRGRISRPNQDATRQCRSRLPLGLRAFAAGESRRGQDRVGALQPLAVGYAGNAIFFGQGCGARGGLRCRRKGLDAAAFDRKAELVGGADALRSGWSLPQAGKNRRGGARNPGVPETAESGNATRESAEVSPQE